ncbi:MAG: aspartate 1-decarboxylase [Firmicutes bacterium]|nr:aspartate 1-decarboxylase [Bacillota bacterium]
MFRTLMKSKIHGAEVTETNLDYAGSISIDESLMEASDLVCNERVQVLDLDNGARLETYVIPAPPGSGIIGINGAAAHLVSTGDRVIIIAYAMIDDGERDGFQPKVLLMDAENRILRVKRSETHGPVFLGR